MKKYSNILADERPEFKAANYGFDTLRTQSCYP